MSKPLPAKYRTTNWKNYNAALKSRGSLMIWLDKDLQWQGTATGKLGRPPVFSDAAIQFCLTIKCLFGLALRQTIGFVESLLELAELDWVVPDYSTVCRRQKDLPVTLCNRPSQAGLHLRVDSTGIKRLGEGGWKTKKHGAEYRRQWRKVHLGIDAETLAIRAIEVTDNGVGDAPMLPELLGQIPQEEPLLSVSGDGAYDTKACHEAIAQRQAAAIIPPRSNAKPWKDNRPGALTRNEILRTTRQLGRAIWKKWSGYPPPQPSRDKDGVLQATGGAGNGTGLCSSGCRTAGASGNPESLHCAWNTGDGASGINPPGERGSLPCLRVSQQRPLKAISKPGATYPEFPFTQNAE